MISAIPVQCSIVEVMGIYITVIYFTLPFRDRKRYLGRNSQVTPLPEITGRSNSTYNGNNGIQGDDPYHMDIKFLLGVEGLKATKTQTTLNCLIIFVSFISNLVLYQMLIAFH